MVVCCRVQFDDDDDDDDDGGGDLKKIRKAREINNQERIFNLFC